MNYRHAFHAGNFADVFKHAVLVRLILGLQRKDAAFRILDTHAGIGLYDLAADEATRTGEWRDGIARLLAKPLAGAAAELIAPYLATVAGANDHEPAAGPLAPEALRHYPGSPAIARTLLRRQDRLTLTELHPADAQTLAARFAGDIQTKVIELDGWLAPKSFLPPKERRGLVLIDPPFESRDEFRHLTDALVEGYRRFATGVFALWYPIKDEAEVKRFYARLADTGIRKILAAEFRVARVAADRPLSACGMVVVSPPWQLDGEIATLGRALAERLSVGPGAGASVRWIVPE
jgi:23S rRNA (adenine2030-N6)-methyltransferase